ncbi:hypothetical protein SPI_05115 [Niveomyces insectorum RCEF 264]|uniref:Uncharacterized protein n=1 Tax=Niveomyces insectorum RCEF 264 TaxID=1081102 RepID=A0A167TYW9_9HYPO|nr:hypothetical protein SPI_05115 [Niveomyces insectorum RCEF 264]
MALFGGPWDLQEVITEQRTATWSAERPLSLAIAKPTDSSASSLFSSFAVQPSDAAGGNNGACSLHVVEGTSMIKELHVSQLLATGHEIRLVPPTRATLLYSGTDGQGRGRGSRSGGQGFGRTQSQGNGSQNRHDCFLKFCFRSLGDLKAASQAFLRLGLRCTTQFKPLSRTPSNRAPSAPMRAPLQPMPQARNSCPVTLMPEAPYSRTRSSRGFSTKSATGQFSSQQPAQREAGDALSTVVGGYVAVPRLKRTISESPSHLTNDDRTKRRAGAAAAVDTGSVTDRLRRESSSADADAGLWSQLVSRRSKSVSQAHGQIAHSSRLADASLERQQVASTTQTDGATEQPPPRRDLPPAITRHMSQTPSQMDGNEDALGPSQQQNNVRGNNGELASARRASAEMGVQTDTVYIEPERALVAGMSLFQKLAELKNQLVDECLQAAQDLELKSTKDEDEARLAAHYALEFGNRFVEICITQARIYCQ